MRREDFNHVVGAAAAVVDDDVVVIGSQAVLGPHPDAPPTLLTSLEVDVYPRTHVDRADLIDGAVGDGSPFHQMYGYYAQGVGPETATAPAGWEDRLIPVEIPTMQGRGRVVTAWCLEPHDLVLAKLAAGRPHDLTYAVGALQAGIVEGEQLRRGVPLLPSSLRQRVMERLNGVIAQAADA